MTDIFGGLVTRPDPGQVTQLLRDWSGGEKAALDRLIPLVYRELRHLASRYLRCERPGHTLQTTALVHEAYLHLVNQSNIESHCRAEFFAIAANLMRQILIRHARSRNAAKRGGGNRVTLVADIASVGEPEPDLLALDEALEKLSHLDPRQGRIVELRFFGGLTESEIAEVVGVSVRTVKREWHLARAMLYGELGCRPGVSL